MKKRENEEKDKEVKKTGKTKMTKAEFYANELPHLIDIVGFCNSLPISVYADSTVVKSPEVVYRGLVFSKNRLISEEYLLNYQGNELGMGMFIGVNNYRLPMVMGAQANRKLKEDQQDLIHLPKYKNVNAPIGSVIRSRRSVRKYSGKTMSLEDLATILFYAQGVSGKLHLDNMPETAALGKNDEIEVRTAPSGGGLYPLDLYIIALNIEKLEKGAYLYLPRRHAIKQVKKLDGNFNLSQIGKFAEIEAEKSNFLLVYGYKLFENSRKYGDRGMAFAFIEAGEISENVHLICTAMGFGPCDVGGYAKHRLEKILGLDGLTGHVIHLTVIGN
jgi:SagB-type dehydrogenase family enzyme